MQTKRIPKGYLIRLDQGEELMASLIEFTNVHQIQSGFVSGIGMVREVELAYFNTELAEYEKKTFIENLEVASLSGTIAQYDNTPFFHMHGVFGRSDYSTIAGHVMRAVTDMTFELFVNDFETRVDRTLDDTSGLKLLDL